MLTRYRILPLLLGALVLTTASACATRTYGRYPAPGPRVVDDRAYRVGYESGLDHGRDDARRGRSFDYDRHRDFRNADRGYGGWGSRNDYRQMFRRGFTSGYEDGYRRNNGNVNPGRRGPVYGSTQGRGVSRSPAQDVGYRDGYQAGRTDARNGDRYDAVRERRYREGDRDYNSRYGSLDAYKRDYRSAFLQGYEQGYREARR